MLVIILGFVIISLSCDKRWIFGEADWFFSKYFLFIHVIFKEFIIIFFLLFLITVESKFLWYFYLSCVSVFFTGSYSLMYFLNKDFLTKIDLWIAVVIHGLVFNFNWYLLTFLMGHVCQAVHSCSKENCQRND